MKTTFSLLFFILGTLFNFGQSNPEEVGYFSNNGFGTSVYANSGEQYKGLAYVTCQWPLEDPYVGAYDHKNKNSYCLWWSWRNA